MSNNTKPVSICDDKVDEKYNTFKPFDTVNGHSDHYYPKPELRLVHIVKALFILCHLIAVLSLSCPQPSKDWAKRIQRECESLEKDLPR
jgi:ubiquitin-conjugating enzyme E2 O